MFESRKEWSAQHGTQGLAVVKDCFYRTTLRDVFPSDDLAFAIGLQRSMSGAKNLLDEFGALRGQLVLKKDAQISMLQSQKKESSDSLVDIQSLNL